MEATRDIPQPEAAYGELVVQNGRRSGKRRALAGALLTLGRDEGCDIRLNAEGVGLLHCALVRQPDGLLLRNLHSANGTQVNGQQVTSCTLRDGDLLAVGPFRFQIHLFPSPNSQSELSDPAALEREKEALRIQAAAVAAQQAALTEQESRLEQRRGALKQQEGQLAALLEDKRQRLVELRDAARQERREMQAERAVYERRVTVLTRDLDRQRREVAEARQQILTDRQHLVALRARLKGRWHRLWGAARADQRQRERELDELRRLVEEER